MGKRIDHVARLMGSQSAFCMRDLMSLAAADAQPDELARIYEW